MDNSNSSSQPKHLLPFILAILFLALGYYFGRINILKGLMPQNQKQAEIFVAEDNTSSLEADNRQEAYFENATSQLPKNPTSATATCADTGATITNGQPTTCANPVFSWTGAQGSAAGPIDGYLVYWYEATDAPPQTVVADNTVTYLEAKPPIVVATAEFRPWPSDLAPGKTYHLMVQTQIDSRGSLAQTGGEVVDRTNNIIQNADILFVYNYQP